MNSCTSIEMMGIRGENSQFRLTWTESQSAYDRGDEKLKRQPDTQGGITLIAAFNLLITFFHKLVEFDGYF